MSGKRQHFIPRFLQSGFSSHSSGDEIFTWVYRKNVEPFNTNIINTGVEGYFYSQDVDSQVDDNITAAEKSFCELVDALRNGSKEATNDSDALAELIAHLEVRTRHLRQSFSNAASAVMAEMARFMEDQQAFGSYMQRRIKSDPSFMRDVIASELKKRDLAESLLPHLLEASKPLLEQMLSSILADISLMATHFRAEIPQISKNAAKSGHIRALKETLSPEAKASRYRTLKYCLFQTTEVALPLGDSPIVIQLNEGRPYKAFCEKDDSIHAVYLPLSPNMVLVGSVDDAAPCLLQIPMAIAQCSLEYFISNSRSRANDVLRAHIGEHAHLLTEDQIFNLITEVKNA